MLKLRDILDLTDIVSLRLYRHLFDRQVKTLTAAEFEKYLGVKIGENFRADIYPLLITELCKAKFGMIYCLDYQAKHGVRKIITPPQ